MSRLTSHRAVAVIIGHILLVAITVIGGMLIFVFVQDFIDNTQVEGPTVEQLNIWGYNATDAPDNKLGTHNGREVTVTSQQNNYMIDGEDFFMFIRNTGGTDVFISQIRIFGISLAPDTTFSTTESLDARAGTWMMSINGKDPCRCQIIKSGQEATIVIGYDEEINGKLPTGKPIHVNIITGEETSFTKHLVFGLSEGLIKPKLIINSP